MSTTNTTVEIEAAPDARPGAARLIAACTIGNALEFYDFVIFSFYAGTIGALFFPAQDATGQLLLSFATYGVGFFLRPLGGVVLGAYADRKGRKPATVLTLFLMALGTAMIGLAPSYASIGIAAPAVVVLGRLIQGFSAGGEVGASTTLLSEYAPPAHRGFFGSWQMASQGLAILVAASMAFAVTNLLPPDQVKLWGWRVPFLIGVLIVPIGLWLRQALRETHANEDDARTRETNSLAVAFREHWRQIAAGVALIIGGTASNAIIVIYMSTYAVRQLKLPPSTGLLAGITAGLVTLIAAPVAGALSDRLGRKRVAGVSYGLIAVLIYPAFLLLNAVTRPANLATNGTGAWDLERQWRRADHHHADRDLPVRRARHRHVAGLRSGCRDFRRLRPVHRDMVDRHDRQPDGPGLVCGRMLCRDAAGLAGNP